MVKLKECSNFLFDGAWFRAALITHKFKKLNHKSIGAL